jgi:hypothetical protein
MCSAPRNPPPPKEITLPEAPKIPNLIAPTSLQAGPARPREKGVIGENPTLARRGKRSLVIPMGGV